MTSYIAILFIHAIAVLVLTAALTVETWMLLQLRRASSVTEIRSWTSPLPGLTAASIGSLVVVYITGAYLTESLHAWEFAWPRLAVFEIVLFAALGAFTGKRLSTIRRRSSSASNEMRELSRQIQSSWLKLSLSFRIWIVFGTILLTAAKPGLNESLVIVASSAFLGWISSLPTLGRMPKAHAPK